MFHDGKVHNFLTFKTLNKLIKNFHICLLNIIQIFEKCMETGKTPLQLHFATVLKFLLFFGKNVT